MPAQQPSLSARARWIIRTQLAALSPARRHTPGIHTRATEFLPFTSPARDAVAVAFREARRHSHRHWVPGPAPARPGRPGPGHGRTRAAAGGDQPGASTSASRADHRPGPAAGQARVAAPRRPDPGSGSRGGATLRLPHRHQSSPARRVPRRRPDRRPRASPARCRGKPGPRRDHRPAGRVRPEMLRVTSDPAMGPSQLQGGTFQPGRPNQTRQSSPMAMNPAHAANSLRR